MYLEIGDHFRKLYGGHAGWAHSVLFSADLRQFKSEGKTIKKEVCTLQQQQLASRAGAHRAAHTDPGEL